MLEHMDFVQTNDGRRIKDETVNRGANCYDATDFDRTNYYETFTATDGNLRWALGLEADRTGNVNQSKQFERGENSAAGVLDERVMATAYIWHNYGKAVIGSREDIEKAPNDRLAEFCRKYCQPDNAVLVVGGRIAERKTLAMVADTVGKIPRPRKLDATCTVEPPQDSERGVELWRAGTGQYSSRGMRQAIGG